jgi:hypothetical protein
VPGTLQGKISHRESRENPMAASNNIRLAQSYACPDWKRVIVVIVLTSPMHVCVFPAFGPSLTLLLPPSIFTLYACVWLVLHACALLPLHQLGCFLPSVMGRRPSLSPSPSRRALSCVAQSAQELSTCSPGINAVLDDDIQIYLAEDDVSSFLSRLW